MPILTVRNTVVKPQDPLPSKNTFCVDSDGTTVKVIDMKKEFENSLDRKKNLILFYTWEPK